MKHLIKRSLSFLLVSAFAAGFAPLPHVSGGLLPNAVAANSSDLTAESYNFTMQDRTAPTVPASFSSASTFRFLTDQQSNQQNSWVFSAYNVLGAAERKVGGSLNFSLNHIDYALANNNANALGFSRKYYEAGNRLMTTAYLTRGKLGGPVSGFPDGTTSLDALTNEGERTHVSGVVFLPDVAFSATDGDKAVWMQKLKGFVQTYGAAALSVRLDDENGYHDLVPNVQSVDRYQDCQSSATANNTVTLVGWDDNIVLPTYTIETPVASAAPTVTTIDPGTGAFLVQDSHSGRQIWLSYKTVLKSGKNAYAIKGFVRNNDPGFTTLSSGGNPFAATYEYDPFGVTGAMGYNEDTAYFANVFASTSTTASLQAVSVFLTGEGNAVEIWYLPEFSTADDLKNIETNPNAVRVVSQNEDLPGYYTYVADTSGLLRLPAKGKKFAVVAKVTCTNGTAPIPVQNTSLYKSGGAGKGFTSRNAQSWSDVYNGSNASICLKAHTEENIPLLLTDVALPYTTDGQGAPIEATHNPGVNVLQVAPGGTANLSPILTPQNATDVVPSMTTWEVIELPFPSDEVGPFNPSLYEDLEYDKTSDTNNIQSKIPVPGYPQKKDGTPIASDTPAADRVESPFTINLAEGANKGVITVSKNEYNHGKRFVVRVTVSALKTDANGQVFPSGSPDFGKTDPAKTKTAEVVVEIKPIGVDEITLSKDILTMKCGSTATLTASLKPANASSKKVTWNVYADANKTPFAHEKYDPADPFNPDGPIVTISDTGKVTALRDGDCYVSAEVNGIESDLCRITVTKVAATGISVNKKKFTLSVGARVTFTATVKPSTASDKGVTWSLKSGDAVTIDSRTGVVSAVKAGTATIVAANKNGDKAECVVTVTEAPTGVVRLTKSSTLTLLGLAASDKVSWEFITLDGSGNVVLKNDDEKLEDNNFTGAVSGNKFKVTAKAEGRTLVRASVSVDAVYDNSGVEYATPQPKVIKEQIFVLESVIALSKLALAEIPAAPATSAVPIKKLTLCVASSAARNQSATIMAQVVKPTDATLLDFSWSSKNPDIADVVVVGNTGDHNATVTVQAKKVGSVRITGVNYNGNKKISITVKVQMFPTAITTKLSGTASKPFPLAVGKSKAIKGKVNAGRNICSELRYFLYAADGTSALDADDPIAKLDEKGRGKVTACKEGVVTLVIRGAPYDSTAPSASVVIDCSVPVKSISINAPKTVTAGETVTFEATVLPANATHKDLLFSGATVTKQTDTVYTFAASGVGTTTITVASKENSSKKKTVRIKVLPRA